MVDSHPRNRMVSFVFEKKIFFPGEITFFLEGPSRNPCIDHIGTKKMATVTELDRARKSVKVSLTTFL